MHTLIKFGFAAAVLSATVAVSVAGQPATPGAFGRDRADGVQSFQSGGANDTGAPGASEWGQIASDRAGTNGDLNRAYKTDHGGDPTHGNE